MKTSSLYIFGKNPVTEIMKRTPEKVRHVFVRDSVRDQAFAGVYSLAKEKGVSIDSLALDGIEERVGSDARHQGVIAEIDPFEYASYDEVLKNCEQRASQGKSVGIVALDGIEDPHNMGAIIRSLVAANVDALFVEKRGRAPIGSVAYKTSAGTLGSIPVIEVANLSRTLSDLQKKGYWVTVWDMDGTQSLWTVPMNEKSIWVIGGEGKGVSPALKKNADVVARIPLSNNVESLNASVTAGLVAFEWKRRKEK